MNERGNKESHRGIHLRHSEGNCIMLTIINNDIHGDIEVPLPVGYLEGEWKSLTLREGGFPGDFLAGKARRAFQHDSIGVNFDDEGMAISIYLRGLRHLSWGEKSFNKAIIAKIRRELGDDYAERAMTEHCCPLLTDLGISKQEQLQHEIKNTPEIRTSSLRCPYCIGSAIHDDVKRGAQAIKAEKRVGNAPRGKKANS